MTQEPPAKKRNISRFISRNIATQRHPLNVKPGENALIFQTPELQKKKRAQLGVFADFPDELILEFLSFFDDPKDLMNLALSSKVWYAYGYDEETWRKLYIRLALQEEAELGEKAPTPPLGINDWQGSWRRTMLGLPESKEAKLQLDDNLLCSDMLFRPYQCSQIDYKDLLKDLIKEERESSKLGKTQNTKFGIERIDEKDLSPAKFQSEYTNKPFILTNKSESRWPEWSLPYLRQRFSNVKFRQESVQWPLDFYSKYFAQNRDESPLYLFDCQSDAMKQLVQEYEVPKIFQSDVFSVFNERGCRPDYRWIIVGPERSGSTFHKDPNATSAWNANLTGMKLWIMLPPGVKPPGVGTDDDEAEVTAPVGISEWVVSGFYNDSMKLAQMGQCQIGVTFPGECMYVPSGWWHSVINLEDSVALTQNFVPLDTLGDAFWFLRGKKDQISGFHVKDFLESVKGLLAEGKLSDESKKILGDWVEQVDGKVLDNEDIGECSNVPDLPIYEFFLELVKLKGEYDDVLEQGLTKAQQLEREFQKKNQKIVQSKKWDMLIQPTDSTTTSAFSFNFEESDDE